MFSDQFLNSHDQSSELLADRIQIPHNPILNKKTSAQVYLQKFIKESKKVVKSMNGREIEELDDVIQSIQ
jgi:hypothetical protein